MAFAIRKDRERVWELYSMINPVNHAATAEGMHRYKVEPYVMAADVYGVAPHEGRGGWTWYTGSAGWTYQLSAEYILGLRRKGEELTLDPCIPAHWPGFKLNYRFGNAFYHIEVKNSNNGNPRYIINGKQVDSIRLKDDGENHQVLVEI